MTIDQMIVQADSATASLRTRLARPTWSEGSTWTRSRDLSRPHRRRHRALPIEYRISRSELIIMGTALGILIGALSFPLAWILFRWVA